MKLIAISSLLFFIFFAVPGHADDNFYNQHDQGWWFYNEELEPEEKEIPPAPVPSVTVKEEQPTPLPEPKKAEKQEPTPLSVKWLAINIEKARDLAIENPTQENVSHFLYLQKIALDKSQRFSQAVQRAVQNDPILDENTRRPLSSFGATAFNEKANAAKKVVLKGIAQGAGIFFFFDSKVQICNTQADLLKYLQGLYGFTVYPISIDGKGLTESNAFVSFRTDTGQAKALNVIRFPAMFLVRPETRQFIPLGQSAMAAPILEDRIISAALQAGWINQDDYNKTRKSDESMLLDATPDDFKEMSTDQEAIEKAIQMYQSMSQGR